MSTTKTMPGVMPAHSGRGALRPTAWLLLRGMERIDAWCSQARSRRALREMSDTMLKDIGLSRADAWRESRKPFWQH